VSDPELNDMLLSPRARFKTSGEYLCCYQCDYPWSQGSNPEREDRGQKQLCLTYHGIRIKLDGDLISLLGQSAFHNAFYVRLQLKL